MHRESKPAEPSDDTVSYCSEMQLMIRLFPSCSAHDRLIAALHHIVVHASERFRIEKYSDVKLFRVSVPPNLALQS